jgi:hypothetical protein
VPQFGVTYSRSRALGKDIAELFGYAPDDRSPIALQVKQRKDCPFVPGRCSKTNHDQSAVYGTCSVSNGSSQRNAGSEVIICPRRLYADNYRCLRNVAELVWPNMTEFVVGGGYSQLKEAALETESPVIAFGQNSGGEVQFSCNGNLSLDWVLQSYRLTSVGLEPVDYICLEVQSIDTTGNYRDAWSAYMNMTDSSRVYEVPDSGHGLNWANVHKRLIPQLIRKGNVASVAPRCRGLFFVLPDVVYRKFEEVIGNVEQEATFGQQNLSVVTYSLGPIVAPGVIRSLQDQRIVHYNLKKVAEAFIAQKDPVSGDLLDSFVANLLT